MDHLIPYFLFESNPKVLSHGEILILNKITNGTWTMDSNGLINVSDSVSNSSLSYSGVSKDPSLVSIDWNGLLFNCKFGRVERDFFWTNSILDSLEGSPYYVGRFFVLERNKRLVSLDHSPKEIGNGFRCLNCNLTSLANGPQEVKIDYIVTGNYLTDLQGAPISVEETFNCGNNPLTSLAGAPWRVGSFICDSFRIDDWNPKGWVKAATQGTKSAKNLLETLPFFQATWWVEKFNSSKKSNLEYKKIVDFFSSSCAYREFEGIKTEVVSKMKQGFLKNIEDYEDLKSFGID